MEFITAILTFLVDTFGPALYVMAPIVGFIGIVAQMRLYSKANQPAIAAIVPIWNLTTFMKVIGRPTWHIVYMLLPIAVVFTCLMVDYQNVIAFFKGTVGIGAVAITIPAMALSAIVLTVFMVWAHIDLCNSFGRRTVFDYVLVVLLNVMYVLNLGLSYEIEYEGPAYGRSSEGLSQGSGAFA